MDSRIEPNKIAVAARGLRSGANATVLLARALKGVATGRVTNAVVPTNRHCLRIVHQRSDTGIGYDGFLTENIDPLSH